MNALAQIGVLLGTVGLFVYGMKVMSEALQRSAGSRLRALLGRMTSSPGRGVLAGTLITGVIQSSSAVTVMTVSFVNAGLLRLRQAIALIMGANIGTTLTAWLVALFGFNLDIGLLAIPLLGLVIPMLLVPGARFREICQVAVGFALLLLAINILKDSMQALSADRGLLAWIAGFQDYGRGAPLLFVGVGVLLTCLLQSSSAVMALTIVLCAGGTIPFDCGLAMVLGENVGTTFTALVASSVTNNEARRAALSHLLFNLFGLLWALPLLGVSMHALSALIAALGGVSPLVSAAAQPLGLALFHTSFNVVNALLLVGFIPRIAALTGLMLPARAGDASSLRHVSGSLLSTGEISIYQAQREVGRYVRQTAGLFAAMKAYFGEINPGRTAELAAGIEARRQEVARTHDRFERFFAQFAREEVSRKTQQIAQSLLYLISDLGTAAEQTFSLSDVIRRKRGKNIWFAPAVREHVFSLFGRLDEFYELLDQALNRASPSARSVLRARELRRIVKEELEAYQEASLTPDPDEEMNYQAGIIFAEMLSYIDALSLSLLKTVENAFEIHDPIRGTETDGESAAGPASVGEAAARPASPSPAVGAAPQTEP